MSQKFWIEDEERTGVDDVTFEVSCFGERRANFIAAALRLMEYKVLATEFVEVVEQESGDFDFEHSTHDEHFIVDVLVPHGARTDDTLDAEYERLHASLEGVFA